MIYCLTSIFRCKIQKKKTFTFVHLDCNLQNKLINNEWCLCDGRLYWLFFPDEKNTRIQNKKKKIFCITQVIFLFLLTFIHLFSLFFIWKWIFSLLSRLVVEIRFFFIHQPEIGNLFFIFKDDNHIFVDCSNSMLICNFFYCIWLIPNIFKRKMYKQNQLVFFSRKETNFISPFPLLVQYFVIMKLNYFVGKMNVNCMDMHTTENL